LNVSTPDHPSEKEAERVADAIAGDGGLQASGSAPSEPEGKIQRAWSDADKASYPAPTDAGQPATPAGGWNASDKTIGNVERIPLEGLKEGLQTNSAKENATKEDDAGKAVAVVPMKLKPGQPVEIFLHFHGHNVGYRERSQPSSKSQHPSKDDLSLPQGSARDVSADRIEQQMDASGRNMIGILPQGTAMSGFGPFHADAYVSEVWDKLVALNKLPRDAKRGAVVLAGHSGAGSPLTKMMNDGTMPASLGELVLFDAINDGGQLTATEKFLHGRMSADLEALKEIANPTTTNGGVDAAAVATQQSTYLASSFRFRGIYTAKYHPQKKEGGKLVYADPPKNSKPVYDESVWTGYGVQYEPLLQFIKSWIDTNSKGLPASVVSGLRDNYKVTPAGPGATHNTILSSNDNLKTALGALPSGTSAPGEQPAPSAPARGSLVAPARSIDRVISRSMAEEDATHKAGVQAKSLPHPVSQQATIPEPEEARQVPISRSLDGLQRKSRESSASSDAIYRDPAPAAAPTTDEQQWEKDWNDMPAQQRIFAEHGRPSGIPRQRYDKLCPMYKSHGVARPLVYLSTMVTAKFYNFSTTAHPDLAAALATAEATLKAQGYADAPVSSVGALVVRTTSAGTWSNHATGKAVDLDPDRNPHVRDAKERKMIGLVTDTDFDASSQGFDPEKATSDKFSAHYNSAGLQQRVKELQAAEKAAEGERDALKEEIARLKEQEKQLKAAREDLKKQLKAVPHGKKGTPEDASAEAGLNANIHQNEADAKSLETAVKQKQGELTKKEAELRLAHQNTDLVEKQFKKVDAIEKSISTLEGNATSATDEIKTLDEQIAQSTRDEQDAVAANDQAAVKAQRALRARLEQTSAKQKADLKKTQGQIEKTKKHRDADPLQKYANDGMVNLQKDVVSAMTGAGLKWGGNWEGPKDFMHFDL
jgi:hypothetical protein